MLINTIDFTVLTINNRFTQIYMDMSKNGKVHLPMNEPVQGLPYMRYRKRFEVKHLIQCTLRTGTTQKAFWMEKLSDKKLKNVCAQLFENN